MATDRFDDITRRVATRLRVARMNHGMTQHDLGRLLGCTFQQVQKYEKATNRISPARLKVCADTFGLPITFFFDEAENSASDRDKFETNLFGHLDRSDLQIMSEYRRLPAPLRERIATLVSACVEAYGGPSGNEDAGSGMNGPV